MALAASTACKSAVRRNPVNVPGDVLRDLPVCKGVPDAVTWRILKLRRGQLPIGDVGAGGDGSN